MKYRATLIIEGGTDEIEEGCASIERVLSALFPSGELGGVAELVSLRVDAANPRRKRCQSCKLMRPTRTAEGRKNFHAHPSTKDKLQPVCADCQNDARRSK